MFKILFMETLKIEFQSNIREELLGILNSFSKNDLKFIIEKKQFETDNDFINHRDKLQLEVHKIKSGESKLRSLDELDIHLDEIISKHEN